MKRCMNGYHRVGKRCRRRRGGRLNGAAGDWAKAHPWMTFFIITGVVSTIGVALGAGKS